MTIFRVHSKAYHCPIHLLRRAGWRAETMYSDWNRWKAIEISWFRRQVKMKSSSGCRRSVLQKLELTQVNRNNGASFSELWENDWYTCDLLFGYLDSFSFIFTLNNVFPCSSAWLAAFFVNKLLPGFHVVFLLRCLMLLLLKVLQNSI